MKNLFLKNWPKKAFTLMMMLSDSAFAFGGGNDLPFTSTMNTLKDAISGPFLLAASIIMIVITCLMLAFGEWGDGFKKLINIALWLSIAFSATSFLTSMFGVSSI